MVKGKDLKEAQIFQMELDKIRPYTFDFNTLAELQELGYPDPYLAIAGLNSMNLNAMKALVMAGLISGQAAEDDSVQVELTKNRIGQILGSLMVSDNKKFQDIFNKVGKSVSDFFPEQSTEEVKSADDGAKESEKN